jgi:hypothetical protein
MLNRHPERSEGPLIKKLRPIVAIIVAAARTSSTLARSAPNCEVPHFVADDDAVAAEQMLTRNFSRMLNEISGILN